MPPAAHQLISNHCAISQKMLVFSVLLLATSALAGPAVFPVGSSVPGVKVDKVTTYKPEFVGRNVNEPHVHYPQDVHKVPGQLPVANQPAHNQQHQPVVGGRHFASQSVQQPSKENVFFHQQPKHVDHVQVLPVHQPQPFRHLDGPAVHHPQVPVHFQSRLGLVDQESVNVAPKSLVVPVPHQQLGVVPNVVVEPKHHVFGHDFVAGVVRNEGITHQEVVSDRSSASARILQQDMDINPDGSFYNVWNSDNGIKVEEQGIVKRVGDTDVTVQNGQISYVDNEGNTFYIKYVADETGFHVEGDHLPTPPPIPAAIARGLQFIADHPYVETTTVSDEKYQSGQPGQTPVVLDN